jgi:hypothetical protein
VQRSEPTSKRPHGELPPAIELLLENLGVLFCFIGFTIVLVFGVLHREPFTIVLSFVLAAFYGFRSVRGVRRTLRSIQRR